MCNKRNFGGGYTATQPRRDLTSGFEESITFCHPSANSYPAGKGGQGQCKGLREIHGPTHRYHCCDSCPNTRDHPRVRWPRRGLQGLCHCHLSVMDMSAVCLSLGALTLIHNKKRTQFPDFLKTESEFVAV